MAIFIDSNVAEAVANVILNEPGAVYLCHVVPNFEAEWNKYTSVGTLGNYLTMYYEKQREAFGRVAHPGEELTRSVRAYLVLNMNPLFHRLEGEFGRDLDANIRGFFRERLV